MPTHRLSRATSKVLVALLVDIVVLLARSPHTLAQFQPLTAPATARTNLSEAQQKIEASVLDASASIRVAAGYRSTGLASSTAEVRQNPVIRVDNRDRVHLYIQLTEATPATFAALGPTGRTQIEIVNEDLKLVQAWVPYDEIETIAAQDVVVRVRPPDYATYQTGSTTTQGDTILKAVTVRSTLGITGAGVKVGVISDGANDASSSQASGELPSSLRLFGSCNPSVTESTCNEGTAVMEIIHDVAPGASLAMGAATTSLEFIRRVEDLRRWGAKVIVDDLAFFAQPYFEDGIVAQAYASAVAQGIVVISAAGNEAREHYQGLYVENEGFHDFGGRNVNLSFQGKPLSVLTLFLQWSNRFGAASDNYDLCALDENNSTVIACSRNPQTGTQDPIETLTLYCNSFFSNCKGNVKIERIAGAAQTLEFFILGAIPAQFLVSSDSIVGHAAVPGVISVSAIAADDPGNTTIQISSSRGPSTILLPSLEQRATPALTAIDCVSNSGAGDFPRNFCGTSAAAAHVAAVAALVLQAKPNLTPAQVGNLLQSTAADRGVTGYDNTYGSGLVNALEAVLASIANPAPTITSLSPASVPRGAAAFTLTVNGSDFLSDSVVNWNGESRLTTFVSPTQLTVSIAETASAASVPITVFTPAPGGGISNTVLFPINNTEPTLSSLSITNVTAGAAAFLLTVNGSNFVAESVVRWNGSDRATTLLSSTQLSAAISANDVATGGTNQVMVFTPGPGGGTTSAFSFTVVGPRIFPGGVFNSASFRGPGPAAGSIVTIFGSDFATSVFHANTLPSPTTLGEVSVRWNNIAGPLFDVSPTQINAQVPWEMLGQLQTSVVVTANGTASAPVTVNLSAAAPAIFTLNSQGTGQGAIVIADGPLAAPSGSIPGLLTRPANRGEFITIYCTGLGEVTNTPASGAAASGVFLSSTTAPVGVRIGNIPAAVAFSGLAPGFVGLYQINVQVPEGAPVGSAVPVVLTEGGIMSNSATMAVE